MNNLTVKSFGPIENANVDFGDLTLLVGPQASGKSIFIQLTKLLIDKYHIRKTLEQYGYIWNNGIDKILDLYFGEGMCNIWNEDTTISFDNKKYTKEFLAPKRGRGESTTSVEEELFYIPAQRILSVADGRPKTFMEFDVSTPYVLRQYSETLRQLLQNGMGKNDSIFPISNRLKEPLRKSFNNSIFHDGKVVMDERSGQKKLRMDIEGMSVPFITWSAGQKEFMPLLLGFYWLCPPSKVSKKDSVKYVVIEEPEMGLHPQAIKSIILQIIDLLSRGYKIIVSTHSPVFLEFAWAFNNLKNVKANESVLYELFGISKTTPAKKLFEGILKDKIVSTYYFERSNDKVITKNISELDAGSEDDAMSEWGGLSTFSAKTTEIISKIYANEG